MWFSGERERDRKRKRLGKRKKTKGGRKVLLTVSIYSLNEYLLSYLIVQGTAMIKAGKDPTLRWSSGDGGEGGMRKSKQMTWTTRSHKKCFEGHMDGWWGSTYDWMVKVACLRWKFNLKDKKLCADKGKGLPRQCQCSKEQRKCGERAKEVEDEVKKVDLS